MICCIEEVEEGACVWKEVEELLITTQQRQARAATQDRKEHLDY
jgi:chaperonin cofactor prefoldin